MHLRGRAAAAVARNRARLALGVGFAALAASCSRKGAGERVTAQDGAPQVAAERHDPSDARAEAAASSATAKTARKAEPPPPLGAEDKSKRHSYFDAMGKGRAATSAHRYDDAIAAFDEATRSDQDGRSYAERGYAYFLSRRYVPALEDFERAASIPANADLAAQVWFNRGLTYAALGRDTDADLAFYRSNRLNPTKAAEARVGKKKICPVTVERKRVPAKPYAGWRAWADAMTSDPDSAGTTQGYVADATEAKAAERYCGDCKGDGPWTVDFGRFEGAWPSIWTTHVMARHDGKLWDYGAVGGGFEGPASGEPCGSSEPVTVGRTGKYGSALAASVPRLRVPMKLDHESSAISDCPDDSAWDDCVRWCMASSATETWVVFDLERPARVMTVQQDTYFQRTDSPTPAFDVEITPGANGLDVRGEACTPIPYEEAVH